MTKGKTMKTLSQLFLITVFIGVSSFGCQEDVNHDLVSAELGSPFELGYAEKAFVSGTGISIAFSEVIENSLCPTDVRCAWEGRLTVQLLVSDTPMNLSIGGMSEPSQTLDGFKFTLLELVAPELLAQNIPLVEEYVITLLVEKVEI